MFYYIWLCFYCIIQGFRCKINRRAGVTIDWYVFIHTCSYSLKLQFVSVGFHEQITLILGNFFMYCFLENRKWLDNLNNIDSSYIRHDVFNLKCLDNLNNMDSSYIASLHVLFLCWSEDQGMDTARSNCTLHYRYITKLFLCISQ
jgi:hypothetical protein